MNSVLHYLNERSENAALQYVNERSEANGESCLYDLKRIDGVVYGKILPEEKEMSWLPKFQLPYLQEGWIDKWIQLGGDIDDRE